MDPEEKYKHWQEIAKYDLETAYAMLEAGRYAYVAFMCQQAVEKMVKGLHVLYLDEEAVKTHNIAKVFKSIFDKPVNSEITGQQEFGAKQEKVTRFFAELLYYYISERYPSYKRKVASFISKEKAEAIFNETKEVFIWLESLSQYRMK
ncbi:MAG: HEPN domain-containing protein [Bacillota bacterium]